MRKKRDRTRSGRKREQRFALPVLLRLPLPHGHARKKSGQALMKFEPSILATNILSCLPNYGDRFAEWLNHENVHNVTIERIQS